MLMTCVGLALLVGLMLGAPMSPPHRGGRQRGFIGTILGAVAGPLISGIFNSGSSDQAAGGYQAAGDTSARIFGQTQENVKPWLDTGKNALADLTKFLGITGNGLDMSAPGAKPFSYDQFYADPGYKFVQNEQLGALTNRQSALGGVMGGNTLRAITDYATGAASTEYGGAYNRWRNQINDLFGRLTGSSSTGVNAGLGVAGVGTNAAAQIGSSQIGAAQYGAAGNQAIGNSLQTGIQNLFRNNMAGGAGYNAGGGSGGFGGSDLAGSSFMYDGASYVPII